MSDFSLMTSDRDRRDVTYFYERLRAIASGILETAGGTFLLLIVVQELHGGATTKSVVVAASNVGLLLTPLAVTWVLRRRWRLSATLSISSLISAASFLVMALIPDTRVFVVGAVIALGVGAAFIPLFTQLYQENYPERERGTLFSRAIMIRVIAAMIFGWLAGWLLESGVVSYRWLLVGFAAASLFSAFCLRRCPSGPLRETGNSHPFRAFRHLVHNRLFRWTMMCWMLVGFANLMMLPLRIDYLANPKYGLCRGAAEIALLVVVIPNAVRFVLNPMWGWLFDRMNFFTMRITINLAFGIGILSFFTTGSQAGLLLSAVVMGVASAGGDVSWSLWVTKVAPPEDVADYMSVHTFFTGFRGVIAPFTAFQLAAHLPLSMLGWISFALILVASVMLLPELKNGFDLRARPAAAPPAPGPTEDE